MLTLMIYPLQTNNVGDYLYLTNGIFKFEVGPHQLNLRLRPFSQFPFNGKKHDFQRLAGLWLSGKVVNHVGIDGSKFVDGFLAFKRRSCFYYFKTMKTTTFRMHHWRNMLLALWPNTNFLLMYLNYCSDSEKHILCDANILSQWCHRNHCISKQMQFDCLFSASKWPTSKENIEFTHNWAPVNGISISDQWIPLTDGQLYGELFHSLTLSRCLSSRMTFH